MILTGGQSTRMGFDKAALEWNGVRAIDHLDRLARDAGARITLSVGPVDYGLERVVEEPAGGGPAAGVAAGAQQLRALGCDRALVLAVDAPTVRTADLAPLLGASSPGAAYDGHYLPLFMWLEACPKSVPPGTSMRSLIEHLRISLVCPPEGAAQRLRGANTLEERQALRTDAPISNG